MSISCSFDPTKYHENDEQTKRYYRIISLLYALRNLTLHNISDIAELLADECDVNCAGSVDKDTPSGFQSHFSFGKIEDYLI